MPTSRSLGSRPLPTQAAGRQGSKPTPAFIVMHRFLASRCLQLALEPTEELVPRWHAQNALHAFTDLPPWLFTQIPGFLYRAPGWPVNSRKLTLYRVCYICHAFAIPVHLTSNGFSTGLLPHPASWNAPTSGHYTTVTSTSGQQYWLLDDEKEPRLISDSELNHLSVNMYLLLLVQNVAAHSNSILPSCISDSACSSHGCASSAAHSPGRGSRLDFEPALLDSNPALSSGRAGRVGTAGAHSNAVEAFQAEDIRDAKHHGGNLFKQHFGVTF